MVHRQDRNMQLCFLYVLIRKYSCVLTVCIIHNILCYRLQSNHTKCPHGSTIPTASSSFYTSNMLVYITHHKHIRLDQGRLTFFAKCYSSCKWAGLLNERVHIAISGVPNYLNYCIISKIYRCGRGHQVLHPLSRLSVSSKRCIDNRCYDMRFGLVFMGR